MTKIDFTAFEDALKTFEEAIKFPPKSDLEWDGVIQRFEYTFELCWKSIRKLLLEQGRNEVSSSPKPLFRDTYNKKTAEEVFADIQDFGINARKHLNKLNERIK
jgi:hypothetical protein